MKYIVSTIVGLLLLPLVAVCFLAVGNAGYHELMPTRSGFTNEEQTNLIYLGPLVFRIKNKFLAYPFPPDGHPFDGSVCYRKLLQEWQRKLCNEPKTSVSLLVPVPGKAAHGQGRRAKGFVAEVMLGHDQGYIFDHSPVEAFASEKNAWEGGRRRLPELDTKNYAAVLVLPSRNLATNPMTGRRRTGSYFFVRRDMQSPHVIFCWGPPKQSNMACVGTTGFMKKNFPREPNGQYPYTVQYSFPGSDIDQAHDIQRAVVKAGSALPHAAAAVKVDQVSK